MAGPDAVDFDGVSLRIVHYCMDNNIPLEFSSSTDAFKDKDGSLDDVKLVKAFNDDKAPLTVRAKTLIPADAVTFGVFGGLTEDKRVPQILRAFADLRAWIPGVRLLLAGTPEQLRKEAEDVSGLEVLDTEPGGTIR